MSRVISRLAPVLPCSDVGAALAYYAAHFGFETVFSWGDPLTYAIAERDGWTLHLSLTPHEFQPVTVYAFTADSGAVFAELQEKGARCVTEPQVMPWRMKEFEVLDPDGNRIIFGQSLEE